MSDVVEKTLIAFPSLLSLDSKGGAGSLSVTSRLGSLIRNITSLTSKHEEEKLIRRELASLKEQVASPNTTLKQMKECIVRLVYCEMLGYEASFGYIHAIKLAQQGSLLEKRVGYLAVSLFLHENHELLLLLVNTVLKDLQSTNLVEVCIALTVVSQVFPRDMIPAVLPLIEDKLQHSKEIIRRKAVLALYKFYLIAPNQVQHIHDKFQKALCDRDAGVMAASLHIYHQMIKQNPSGYKDLTRSFVDILKQVVGGKLPLDFSYHNVPAPWLQIQLLRILGLLGKDDQRMSEVMYDVLDESLRRAEINHNITYAILFECVRTIYTIYPKSDLLEKAAMCVGLKALTSVVQQDPKLALQHQMTIIECLDHPDPIIKMETLELLYRITNEQNVMIIVQKMLDYLKKSKDEYTTINIVGKVAELAEKYAPNNEWFVQTMNAVFSAGGDIIHSDIPNNFLRLLAEGVGEEEEDRKLRLYAIQTFLTLLEKEHVYYPQRLLQVMSWILGEYSYLKTDVQLEDVVEKLSKLLKQNSVTSETKAWIIAAITKLSAANSCSETITSVVQEYSTSLNTCLRQHAFELKHLNEDKLVVCQVFPGDRSCNIVVDASLSFLDGFVADALGQGAAAYKPRHQRQEETLAQEKALNFEPYGLPFHVSPPSLSVTGRQSPTGLSVSSELSDNSTETGKKGSDGLKLEGVKKVWGKEGYLPQKEANKETLIQTLPVSQDSTVVGYTSNGSPLKNDHLVTEGEKKKQQLASSLFLGLGSSSSINLMGTPDKPQKFRRKARTNEAQNNGRKLVSIQNSTPSSFSLPSELFNSTDIAIPTQQNEPAPVSSDIMESPLMADNTLSEMEVKLHGNLSDSMKEPSSSLTLFEHDNMEIVACSLPLHESVSQPVDQTPFLAIELAEYAHSKVVSLCTNEVITVHFCKVWKHDTLEVFIFITNTTMSAVRTFEMKISHSEELQVTGNLNCHFEKIEPHTSLSCQYCVQMKRPCTQEVLSGHIIYHLDHDLSTELQFTVNLVLSDFIRPLQLSTEEFGDLWLSHSNDVKQNVKLLLDTKNLLSIALETLKEKLRLHVVAIIGKEGIVACQLLPSTICLIHCRVHAGMLTLWLRSSSSVLPDCLLYHCQKVMEELHL
ncbi:AP-4 complex subunit epsilon-1 isoform X2 [Protopterus annectens]|uniref:AP-4 complex subunit epsilon-1 isoform X2 n=1 Tax=Protopterus annectens TaxID=7888 RepID=UPI001CFAF4DD|nr:AP-4 complex subunit epsilon-1 isoform X2 [Protopterus annectens]